MFCEISPCPEQYRHAHCDDCKSVLLAQGHQGEDGYADAKGNSGAYCKGCDYLLCAACIAVNNGLCASCHTEIATANADAAKRAAEIVDTRALSLTIAFLRESRGAA